MGNKLFRIFLFALCVFGVLGFLAHPLGLYDVLFASSSAHVPLGYDAGLYRSLFEGFGNLGGVYDTTILPDWILRMYPPLLGMLYRCWSMVTGVGSDGVVIDWLLRFGIVCVALCVVLSIKAYTQTLFQAIESNSSGTEGKKSRRSMVAWLSIAVSVSSFVLYNLYWWGYWKQLIAGVLLLSGCALLLRKRYVISMLPFLGAVMTQRPAIILVFAGVVIIWLFTAKKSHRLVLLLGSGLIALLAYIWFGVQFDLQIVPLIKPFFAKLHPSRAMTADGFQSGGTFLTILDYLKTSWIIIVGGLIGTIMMLKQRTAGSRFHGVMVVTLLLWVFGQGFFFQRMIGYLELFLIPGVVYSMYRLIDQDTKTKRMWGYAIVGVLLGLQLIQSLRRQQKIRFPIIERDEFAFIQEIDTLIEEKSVIIVPGADYSPRLAGWTSAEILAPGLFDLNERGSTDQDWQQYWRQADPQEKCTAIDSVYRKKPGYQDYTFYVWVGSKQKPTNLGGACFTLLKASGDPFYAFYRLEN